MFPFTIKGKKSKVCDLKPLIEIVKEVALEIKKAGWAEVVVVGNKLILSSYIIEGRYGSNSFSPIGFLSNCELEFFSTDIGYDIHYKISFYPLFLINLIFLPIHLVSILPLGENSKISLEIPIFVMSWINLILYGIIRISYRDFIKWL